MPLRARSVISRMTTLPNNQLFHSDVTGAVRFRHYQPRQEQVIRVINLQSENSGNEICHSDRPGLHPGRNLDPLNPMLLMLNLMMLKFSQEQEFNSLINHSSQPE